MRETIAFWFSNNSEFEVVGMASTVGQVTEALETKPLDILVLDLALGGEDALHEIEGWHEKHPQIRILVLSASLSYLIARRAMEGGAAAFISKSDSSEELVEGLRKVRDGSTYISRSVQPYLNRTKSTRLPQLTRREEDILREVASGRRNREIAGRLEISSRTVERHRENIKSKLQLSSGAELVREAIRLFPSEGE